MLRHLFTAETFLASLC